MTTGMNGVSDKVNDYFIDVGNTLSSQIPTSGPSFHYYLPEVIRKSEIVS